MSLNPKELPEEHVSGAAGYCLRLSFGGVWWKFLIIEDLKWKLRDLKLFMFFPFDYFHMILIML